MLRTVIASLVCAVALSACSGGVQPGGSGMTACIMSQSTISDRLTSPGTARFQNCASADTVRTPEGRWLVTSWVDSQNAFGGTLRTHWQTLAYPVGGSGDWMIRVEYMR